MRTNVTTNSEADGQLELSLDRRGTVRVATHRRKQARWWFDRMRHVVDRASDWHTAQTAPPEQILLPGTYRQPSLPRSKRIAAGAC